MKKIKSKTILEAKFLAILFIILNLSFGRPASLQPFSLALDGQAIASQEKSLSGQLSI